MQKFLIEKSPSVVTTIWFSCCACLYCIHGFEGFNQDISPVLPASTGFYLLIYCVQNV